MKKSSLFALPAIALFSAAVLTLCQTRKQNDLPSPRPPESIAPTPQPDQRAQFERAVSEIMLAEGKIGSGTMADGYRVIVPNETEKCAKHRVMLIGDTTGVIIGTVNYCGGSLDIQLSYKPTDLPSRIPAPR